MVHFPEILHLQYIDKMVVVGRAGLAVRAQLWETVEIPQLQPVSWTWFDMPVGVQQQMPQVQFLRGGGRRCAHAAMRFDSRMWCRLFGALYTGTGPGAVSTGTRLP